MDPLASPKGRVDEDPARPHCHDGGHGVHGALLDDMPKVTSDSDRQQRVVIQDVSRSMCRKRSEAGRERGKTERERERETSKKTTARLQIRLAEPFSLALCLGVSMVVGHCIGSGGGGGKERKGKRKRREEKVRRNYSRNMV